MWPRLLSQAFASWFDETVVCVNSTALYYRCGHKFKDEAVCITVLQTYEMELFQASQDPVNYGSAVIVKHRRTFLTT